MTHRERAWAIMTALLDAGIEGSLVASKPFNGESFEIVVPTGAATSVGGEELRTILDVGDRLSASVYIDHEANVVLHVHDPDPPPRDRPRFTSYQQPLD